MTDAPAGTGPAGRGGGLDPGVDADVVVIGAGQAGLSAAYHLRRVGLVRVDPGPARAAGGAPTFVVLDDAVAPGGAWQHRWPALTMATVHELPGLPLPAGDPHARASDVVPDYFATYERDLDLAVRRPVHVRSVRDLGGPDRLLAVETVETVEDAVRARTWRTRAVVNATGTWSKPFRPVYPGQEKFLGVQLHASDVGAVEEYAGQRVVVVGGGGSGVQLVTELARVAHTTWVTRRPPVWRDEELTPAHRAGIAAGILVPRPMFARLVPHGAVWTVGSIPDGAPTHLRVDTLVWATGYRPALDHLAPLHLRGRGGGIVMDGVQVVADPRVQLVGHGPSASTVSADRAGREAVRNLRRLGV